MRVYVEGVGLRGPGLDGWATSRPVLTGVKPYLPAPAIVPPSALLPANERRRTVQTVKLALAIGIEAFENAGRDATDTATVFTSSGGDGETIHEILKILASSDREISPTRFHNSVHNAPAGYWSIATRSHSPASSLCCYDASFAAGLLEAAVQATVENRAVALIAYDVPYPEPLNSVRSIGAIFGAALVLVPTASEASLAQLDLELRRTEHPGSTMGCAGLEALRRGTPAARSLPLLAGLAQSAPKILTMDYLPGLKVSLSLVPAAARAASPDTGLAITAAR
jgi:hypothetical protein